MTKIMTAHQPNFIPYLGFFDKVMHSDVFIIRDDAQFVEQDWHHRNKIRIPGLDEQGRPQGKWITVPVEKSLSPLRDIRIKHEVRIKNAAWGKYMLRQIKSSYEGTPFFKAYFPQLEEIFLNAGDKLADLNMNIINFLMKSLNMKADFLFAHEMLPENQKVNASEDLVKLCKDTGADVYLSGAGGRVYLDLTPFEHAGIKIIFQDFHHPVYPQKFPGFVPCMAAIDALFNIGKFPVSEKEVLSEPVTAL